MNYIMQFYPGHSVAYHGFTFLAFSILLAGIGLLASRFFIWNAVYRYQLLIAFWMAIVLLPVATIIIQQFEYNLFSAYYYTDTYESQVFLPHFNNTHSIEFREPFVTPFQVSTVVESSPLSFDEGFAVFFTAFFISWMIGVFYFSIRLICSLIKLKRSYNQSVIVEDERILTISQFVYKEIGLTTYPLIAVSSNIRCPGVVGFLRPKILIPKKILTRISIEQIEQMIRHEAAHIHRGDPWLVLVESLSAILLWPNVMLHVLLKQLGEAREEICDNYVLENTDGMNYGKTLLEIAQFNPKTGYVSATVGLINTQSSLEERIKKMLNTRRRIMKKSSMKTFLSIAVCTVIGTAGMSLTHPAWGVDPEIKERIQTEKAEIKEMLRAGVISKLEAKAKIAAMKLEIYKDALEEYKDHSEYDDGEEHSVHRDGGTFSEHEYGEEHSEHDGDEGHSVYRDGGTFSEHEYGEEHSEHDVGEEHSVHREGGTFSERDYGEEHSEHDDDEGHGEQRRMSRYRAIGEEIKHAVESGQVSREDAERRLIEARKRIFSEEHSERGDDVRLRRYREVEERIKDAVEEGDVSREVAERRLTGVRREIFTGERIRERSDAVEDRMERFRKNLAEEIRAGNLTEEEAKEKLETAWSGIRVDVIQGEDVEPMRRFREVEERIKDAVEEGDVSREDAEKRLTGVRRETFTGERIRERSDAIEEWMERFRKNLAEEIRAGNLTEEEAKEKLETARSGIRERMDQGGNERREIDVYLENVGREIREAVRAGKITEEEGHEKIEFVRREIQEKLERKNKERMDDEIEEHLKGVWERLQHAVREGELTKEDAEAKMSEIKKRVFSVRR